MRRSIWPNRPLTGMEAGMVIVLGVLVVLCCLGVTLMSLLSPSPVPAPAPVVTSGGPR